MSESTASGAAPKGREDGRVTGPLAPEAESVRRARRLQELTRRTLGEMLQHEDPGRTMEAWLDDAATLAQLTAAWLVPHPAAQTGAWRSKRWRSSITGGDGDDVAPTWLDESGLDALASGAAWAHPALDDVACPEAVSQRAAPAVNALYALPVLVFGRIEGVVCLEAHAPRTGLTSEELTLFVATLEGFGRAFERRAVERERRAQSERLSAALSQAEGQSRLRGQLVAYLSQEVRAPMGGILADAETIVRGQGDRLVVEASAERIRSRVQRSLTLLDDLIDFSAAELGRLALNPAAHSPVALVQDALGIARARASAEGIALRVACDGVVPLEVSIDASRCRQLFVNLIAAAVELAHGGVVDVRTRASAAGERILFEVVIIAHGSTLGTEQLAAAFVPFTVGPGGASPLVHPLALPLARALARRMGGDVAAEARPGVGVRFFARLDVGARGEVVLGEPTPRAEESPPMLATVASRLEGLRVLAVDDDSELVRVLAFHLERAGARVEVAANGADALAAVREVGRRREAFDVILLDLHMPVMDGFEASVRLRGSGVSAPILGMSTRVSEDRSRALRAGVDEVLGKPCSAERLYAALERRRGGGELTDASSRVGRSTGPSAPLQTPQGPRARVDLARSAGFGVALRQFQEGLRALRDELKRARTADDWEAVTRATVTLRIGGVRHGYPSLTASAAFAEAVLAQEPVDATARERALDALVGLIDSVLA